MEIVYDETTGQVLSEKGWGADGERESNLAVYGKNAILDNAVQYAKNNFNKDAKKLQDGQKLSKGLGKGAAVVAAGFVRADGINKALKNDVTTSSVKDYKKL